MEDVDEENRYTQMTREYAYSTGLKISSDVHEDYTEALPKPQASGVVQRQVPGFRPDTL